MRSDSRTKRIAVRGDGIAPSPRLGTRKSSSCGIGLSPASLTAWAPSRGPSPSRAYASVLVPQEDSAPKRMRVVPCAATRRHLVHLVDVATADDNVSEFERREEPGHHVANRVSPFRDAEPFQPVEAQIRFVCSTSVRELSKLHRHDGAVDNQGCAEAGPQTEKEHRPSAVAPKTLHGRIVHEFERHAKRLFEVEPDP